jgi:uncharacterized protein
MRRLFVDTFYLVALLYRRDAWHHRVAAFSQTLTPEDALLTTDAILVEFLAALSGRGEHLRHEAALTTRGLLDRPRPNITVIQQDRVLFLEGLTLYERRLDKQYSLTDCISMQVMRRESVTDILTNDHHFTQEGFRVLFS